MGDMADFISKNYCDWDGNGGSEEIECQFIQIARETKAAYLITFEIDEDFKPVQHWLPKSQVQINGNSIFIPRWLVSEKELEAYEK